VWNVIIPGAISAIGGLFAGRSKAKAQQRENIRAAQEENIRRKFEIEQSNLTNRFGIDKGNLGVRYDIDSATRRAAKLEDLAGMFREFGSAPTGFEGMMQGIGVSGVDSPEARQMAALLAEGDPYAAQQEGIAERFLQPDQYAGQQARLARMLAGAGQGDSRATLEAEAERQLQRRAQMQGGSLAAAGLMGSGAARASQTMLEAETMGGLSQAIIADQRMREQMAMQGQQAASGIFGQMRQSEMAGMQGASGIYGSLGQAMMGGRSQAAGIYGDLASMQNQANIANAQIQAQMAGQLAGLTMDQRMAAMRGLQGVYSDDAWNLAGADPSQYYLDPGQYRMNPEDYYSQVPTYSRGDTFWGGVGGAFEGVANAYAANPGAWKF